MVDSLGFRLKLGIIAPSTNTSVQPEMDAMRPYGVTNHFGRLRGTRGDDVPAASSSSWNVF